MNTKSKARNVVSSADTDIFLAEKAPVEGARIQTVLGPIRPEELGVTLTHEHLLCDISMFYTPEDRATVQEFFTQPVSLETLGRIRHYGLPNADNVRLTDVSAAVEEVMLYQQYGGDSLVDVSSIGSGRDAVGLARISRATGVHIIMGSSFYLQEVHPPGTESRSEEDLVGQMVREVTEGVEGTRIKAGIIGEVGCSWPLRDSERKVLAAAGRAQQVTGAPVTIHPGRDEKAPFEIMEILGKVGARPEGIIMGHIDRTVFQRSILREIAQSGCYLEWDLFGTEQSYYIANPGIDMPNDAKRMDDIAWIVAEGYGDKVLVAHDICEKARLNRYGGHGYHYLLAHIVPRMRARGFHEDTIRAVLVENPRKVLTFSSPKT